MGWKRVTGRTAIRRMTRHSLESIAFGCSYDNHRTIRSRSPAVRYPPCGDKNAPTLLGFFHTHLACATAFLGVVTSRRNGLCIQWRDLHQNDTRVAGAGDNRVDAMNSVKHSADRCRIFEIDLERGAGWLIKVLWHDGQGMCLFAKRLERGRFIWPSPANGMVTITPAQLGYLLEGIDWRMPQQTWRPQAVGCWIVTIALRCNEAGSDHQVLIFQIRLRRHPGRPEPSRDSRASAGAGPRRYAHDQPASSDPSICHRGSGNAPCQAPL
jgi:hypothetical protein